MQEYTVSIGGIDHTMQLSEEDAERMNATAVVIVTKEAARPTNKARAASKKG